MKLLIDTNVFHKFFDRSHAGFVHFAVPHRCLMECKGQMAIGGSVFAKELETNYARYKKLLLELRKIGKLKVLERETVDAETERIRQLEPDRDFDDPHLIACVILGKAQVVCTDDKRSDKFVLDKKFYPKGHRRPSIYRDKRNVHLFNPCFP